MELFYSYCMNLVPILLISRSNYSYYIRVDLRIVDVADLNRSSCVYPNRYELH